MPPRLDCDRLVHVVAIFWDRNQTGIARCLRKTARDRAASDQSRMRRNNTTVAIAGFAAGGRRGFRCAMHGRPRRGKLRVGKILSGSSGVALVKASAHPPEVLTPSWRGTGTFVSPLRASNRQRCERPQAITILDWSNGPLLAGRTGDFRVNYIRSPGRFIRHRGANVEMVAGSARDGGSDRPR
jgi:hypothetical protein